MTVKVLVSYSTRDLQTAAALQPWMEVAGARVFLAEYTLDPGRPIAKDVEAAIRSSHVYPLNSPTRLPEGPN